MSQDQKEERIMTVSVSVVFSAFIILCTVIIFCLFCLNHNQIEKRKNTKIQINQKNAQREANSNPKGVNYRRGK